MRDYATSPIYPFARLRSGYAFKSGDWIETGIRVVKIANVGDGQLNLTDASRVSAETAEGAKNAGLRSGDVLVGMTGYVGSVARVRPRDLPCVLNQRVGIVEVTDPGAVSLDYLYFALRSQHAKSQMESLAHGSAQPNLSPKGFGQVEIALPPLPEQRRIASVLGGLDDLIDTNQRLVQLLTDSISAAFRVALSAGVKRTAPIGELATVVGGSTPKTAEPSYWDGQHAWATPRDLSRMTSLPLRATERTVTDAGLAKISSGALPVGTLLMSSRAPIGYLAIAEIPVAINQGFIAMKERDEGVSSLYLWQWLTHNMDAVHDRANGSTFQEISKVNFRPIEVAIPSTRSLAEFEALARSAFRAIVELETETADLTATRDELLPLLMSGAVTPGDVTVAS